MRYPGERKYKPCTWCARPVHVWQHVLKQPNRGKFCSRFCYYAARRAFSDALASGQLESLLAPQRARAKAERLSRLANSVEYSRA
jgi:hypothetical protein